jgi:hypothetical protein
LTNGKKWSSIGINYGNYTFAGINHSQIMKEEAVKLNNSLGFALFKEGSDVTVDYTTDKSLSEVTLYDDKNPIKGTIFKKKYCGAENWSRAEAQRLLISLALGKPIDDQFFPDERIAVEVKDQRIPTEFVDAMKVLYKTGVSVSNMRTYEEKPKIIVDKAEINRDILFDIVVPDGFSAAVFICKPFELVFILIFPLLMLTSPVPVIVLTINAPVLEIPKPPIIDKTFPVIVPAWVIPKLFGVANKVRFPELFILPQLTDPEVLKLPVLVIAPQIIAPVLIFKDDPLITPLISIP